MVAFATSIEEEDFFGHRAWRLVSPDGPSALVAERGATLLSWQPSESHEVIDGYIDGDELEAHFDARCLIMAPWCGRIASGKFSFDGASHTVSSPEIAGLGGLTAELEFTRVPAGDALRLTSRLDASDAYPWDLEISVIFSLEGGVSGFEHLSLTIDATNVSESRAPVSIGWHPYLKMPSMDGISNLSLSIPARAKVLTDNRLIPLTGDAAFAGIASPARHDYLGSEKIDQSFTQLVPNEDGVVVTSVTNPARGTQILLTQEPSEAPVVHVFTADNLPRNSRKSIALEPCSAIPDAFNRADQASRIPLESGETRSLTATLSYRPSK